MKKIISFPDQSKSFTYGVEYGRLLEKMERGDEIVKNSSFPVRLENKSLLKQTCSVLGYVPIFGKTFFNEWVEFTGIRKMSTDN